MSTSLLAGVKAGLVHLCRVAGYTDPIWQVKPCSSVTGLISWRAVCFSNHFNL